MALALNDFSIESENTIVLSFHDGTRRRVRLDDLNQYLSHDDVVRIKRSLAIRKNFIKKVLPPGAMVLLLGATVALGWYDIQRLAQIIEQKRDPVMTDVANQAQTPPLTGETLRETPGEAPALNTNESPAPGNVSTSISTPPASTVPETVATPTTLTLLTLALMFRAYPRLVFRLGVL